MEWVPNSDPFIAPNRIDDFDFDLGPQTPGQTCRVIRDYKIDDQRTTASDQDIKLSGDEKWTDLFSANRLFSLNDASLSFTDLPEDGYCILFIPQAADVKFSESESQPANLTDLPISQTRWTKVATAFHLPGHFPKVVARKLTSVISINRTHKFNDHFRDKLWMHTVMTNQSDTQAYAMAATHIACKKLTLAVMIGCSDAQIRIVKRLVKGWSDAIGHPLLMLGVCAELELNRLEDLVGAQTQRYVELMASIEAERVSAGHHGFSWELIQRVRATREASKKAEEEVDTARSQLEKAHKPAIDALMQRYAPPNPSSSRPNTPSGAQGSVGATDTGGTQYTASATTHTPAPPQSVLNTPSGSHGAAGHTGSSNARSSTTALAPSQSRSNTQTAPRGAGIGTSLSNTTTATPTPSTSRPNTPATTVGLGNTSLGYQGSSNNTTIGGTLGSAETTTLTPSPNPSTRPSGLRGSAANTRTGSTQGLTGCNLASDDNETLREITSLFQERFNDIISRLEGLSAKCRINVEGISFTTDIIRSELARQEANTSAQNTSFGTAISFVALIYLPMTAIATIFAMPIFKWENDWKDIRLQSIRQDKLNSTDAYSGEDEVQLPVVSGYIWVYLIIGVSSTVITFVVFTWHLRDIMFPRIKRRWVKFTERFKRAPQEPPALAPTPASTMSTNIPQLISSRTFPAPPARATSR
ncbi:hypothetical protein JX266_001885 [Neoarthrinium moseri]|nr:hypothetical protein JX266_001885 [Neoarthrinium moseri]